MERIIFGHSAIGKTYAEKQLKTIDLECMFFWAKTKEEYEKIIEVALVFVNAGHIVTLGFMPQLRKLMRERNIPYTVVLPNFDDKKVYLERLKYRNDTPPNHLENFEREWDEYFRQNLFDGEDVIILPPNGYLYDLLKIQGFV